MSIVGNGLMVTAAVTAALSSPVAAPAIVAEEITFAAQIGSLLMGASGGISKVLGTWMKPKRADS